MQLTASIMTQAGRRRRATLPIAAAFLALGLLLGQAATPTTAHAATTASASSAKAAPEATIAWGGYSNGKIPTTALTKVGKAYLRTDASTAYSKMAAAFKTAFKKDLSVTEGYRDFPTQQAIWVARYTPYVKAPGIFWSGRYWIKKPNVSVAAVPGTSVHGWALAVDLGSGVNSAKSPEKAWADANGPKYGWYPIGNSFGEPWHFEFTPPATKK